MEDVLNIYIYHQNQSAIIFKYCFLIIISLTFFFTKFYPSNSYFSKTYIIISLSPTSSLHSELYRIKISLLIIKQHRRLKIYTRKSILKIENKIFVTIFKGRNKFLFRFYFLIYVHRNINLHKNLQSSNNKDLYNYFNLSFHFQY